MPPGRATAWPDRARGTPGEAIPPGLRGGDGVFETLRTYGGRPFLLDRHLERLCEGARAIGLTPRPSAATMRRACESALAGAVPSRTEQILRPMVYAAGSGAEFRVEVEPLDPSRAPGRGRGIRTGISPYPHPGRYLVPPGSEAPVKWLARGPLAHALRDARARGWDEGLLADGAGRLIEGTRSNLWAVVDGVVISPGRESHALLGITRSVVLEEARRNGLPLEERPIAREELERASELLLTSSLLGVVQVVRVEGVWPRGRASPEGVVSVLRRAYAARVGANE